MVLDDAVVDDGHPPAGQVRVRIGFGDAAVGRPTGMRDTQAAPERRLLELVLERGDLADGAPQLEVPAAGGDRNAGRVVAAVFEPPQALDQDRNDIAFRDRTDYPTHRLSVLPATRLTRFLRGPAPAADLGLPGPRHRKLVRRGVLADRRARADCCACADLDRGDEHDAGTDEGAVADRRSVVSPRRRSCR